MIASSAISAKVGTELPPFELPITASLIVSAAIASRDFQPVHHDVDVARTRGSQNIFMNILTTQGLVSRFVTDWAGPSAQLRRNAIRLGVPNYPGDTMTLTGTVDARRTCANGDEIDVHIVGRNSLGEHVSGIVTLLMPLSDRDAA